MRYKYFVFGLLMNIIYLGFITAIYNIGYIESDTKKFYMLCGAGLVCISILFLLLALFYKGTFNKVLSAFGKDSTGDADKEYVVAKPYEFPEIVGKKVSVIIPNYNYGRYLRKRIMSVLEQTYKIHELIILDDCSTDDSLEVINEIIKDVSDVSINVIVNEKNSNNVFAQWQKAFESATGDYVWIAEADDYAAKDFLKTAMSGFCNDRVIISYTESSIVNENGEVVMKHSRDMNRAVFNSPHWDSSYLNSGEDEIKNYLCINNSILNVSAVVWKKKDYSEIIKKAMEFKLAGDWYIYSKVLEMGDIAYHSEALNFYRMHSQTVRSNTKAEDEYREIMRIQREMNDAHDIPVWAKRLQRIRRDFLGQIPKEIRNKKIGFLTSKPFKGSGGHRTIVQNINALVNAGYDCDLYLDYTVGIENETEAQVQSEIEELYGECGAKIFIGKKPDADCDLLFATIYLSAKDVASSNVEKKAYFIQDYETLFFPMGDERIVAEDSYSYGLKPVTIGKWLGKLMEEKSQLKSEHFDFCADLSVYKNLGYDRERGICALYQPDKPRRCPRLLERTISEIRKMDKDIDIYVFGSDSTFPQEEELNIKNLRLLSVEELNQLYNKCMVGLSISSSNPSRIPFEMMASGLPVVELDVDNNKYDLPEDGCVLVKPREEDLAKEILKLVYDDDRVKEMSKGGLDYMKDYPLEKGFEQFVDIVNRMLS